MRCWQLHFNTASLALLLFLAACRPVPRQAAFDERLWDSLSCGDIVFLDGATLRSEAVRTLAPSASAYSHVGIVTEAPSTIHHSRNHWRIVHASPGGGSGLPDADARVREEPLEEFLADPHVKEAHLWRWKGDAHIACAAARWAEKQVGLPFDRDFRFETDSALYCTELVWKAFRSTETVLCDPKGEEVRLPFRKGWILFPEQMTTTGTLHRILP